MNFQLRSYLCFGEISFVFACKIQTAKGYEVSWGWGVSKNGSLDYLKTLGYEGKGANRIVQERHSVWESILVFVCSFICFTMGEI